MSLKQALILSLLAHALFFGLSQSPLKPGNPKQVSVGLEFAFDTTQIHNNPTEINQDKLQVESEENTKSIQDEHQDFSTEQAEEILVAEPVQQAKNIQKAPQIPPVNKEKPKKISAEAKQEKQPQAKDPAVQDPNLLEKKNTPHPQVKGHIAEPMLGESNAPSYARFVPPNYPESARKRRLEGQVILRVYIDAQGTPTRWEVLESTHPVFVAAAEQSLRQSTFHPSLENGQAKSSWVRIPIRFILR